MSAFEGKIELIIGPMFSGKSSELQRIVRRHKYANKSCIVINNTRDARYSQENVAATHDKITIPAIKARELKDVDSRVADYRVIAIDEGQFFDDLVEYADKWANQGKIVVVAALDATYQRQPFPQVCNLIPRAESIQKLSAVCLDCGECASFTQKMQGTSSEVMDVGGIEKYHPVCRSCYNRNCKNQSLINS